MSTFRELTKRATALGQEYNNAKAYARKPSPDLTPEALTDRIERDLERVAATYAGRFEGLAGEARAFRDAALAGAAKVRPTLNPTDTAALVRTEQAWTHNVRPLLERGLTLEQVLKTADADGVLGAERFAAGWMRQHANPENRMDFDGLVKRVVPGALARQAPGEASAMAIRTRDRRRGFRRHRGGHSRTRRTRGPRVTGRSGSRRRVRPGR